MSLCNKTSGCGKLQHYGYLKRALRGFKVLKHSSDTDMLTIMNINDMEIKCWICTIIIQPIQTVLVSSTMIQIIQMTDTVLTLRGFSFR